MYRLQVRMHFDAAHYIKDYPGKCSRMHGHRWEVEVVLEGKELDSMNILVDFGVVKEDLEGLVSRLDHFVLNTQLDEENVTAEYLARWFYMGMLEFAIPNVRLVRVTVWESPDCSITYNEKEG